MRKKLQYYTDIIRVSFDDVVHSDEGKASDGISALFLIASFALLFVFGLAIGFAIFGVKAGEFGDFIGGTLNPVLTFLTFMGLLITILLQQAELRETRKELKRSADALEQQQSSIDKQNFDAAFFQMLNTHNSIVNAIDLKNLENGMETKGRDCFRVFYTKLNKIFRENEVRSGKNYNSCDVVRLSYSNFWEFHQLELGHYFRFLYNFFRFIDENSKSETYHWKLLRSQLSDQELLLLFYNCASKNGRNFNKYAEKYKLFDNLPTVRLLNEAHITLVDKSAFGDNPMHNSKSIRSNF